MPIVACSRQLPLCCALRTLVRHRVRSEMCQEPASTHLFDHIADLPFDDLINYPISRRADETEGDGTGESQNAKALYPEPLQSHRQLANALAGRVVNRIADRSIGSDVSQLA